MCGGETFSQKELLILLSAAFLSSFLVGLEMGLQCAVDVDPFFQYGQKIFWCGRVGSDLFHIPLSTKLTFLLDSILYECTNVTTVVDDGVHNFSNKEIFPWP